MTRAKLSRDGRTIPKACVGSGDPDLGSGRTTAIVCRKSSLCRVRAGRTREIDNTTRTKL